MNIPGSGDFTGTSRTDAKGNFVGTFDGVGLIGTVGWLVKRETAEKGYLLLRVVL